MRTLLCTILLLAASTFLDTRAQAQTVAARPTPTPAPVSEESETVTARIVRLPISVLDKKDQPVEGLSAQDFMVFEDKRPQQIDFFLEDRARLPVFVGVLMDTSSSTAGKLKFEQEAAMNFIHTVIRLRKDKVAFVTFDHEVKLRQDFTDKLDLLDRAVYGVKKPGNQTALYDAVWQFCDEKMRGIGSGRRVIVVITDGDDTYSRARLDDAIDLAQRTETIIYAISTKSGFAGSVPGVEAGQVKDAGDRDLTKLCEKTGGKAFFSGDFLELERSFTKIAKELRSQYFVTYKPTNNVYDGSFRKIEVKLAPGRDGLKVRAREGYKAVNDTAR
ncbi:MAG TPA: VWA domain-containing protein [Pyrinomonadaceae bacterium]|nr:VWA domain-containing protein [Pyrinomonadaceae bacterium]